MKRAKNFFLTLLAALLLVGTVNAQGTRGIVSGYYGIDRANSLIGQIAPGTEEAVLLGRVSAPGTVSVSDGVKTGSVLTCDAGSLTLVVQGDCNGDGGFSITDMLLVKSRLLEKQSFSPAQAQAADVNRDGGVTITDFLQMKSGILGLSQLTPGQLVGAENRESLILTPGETRVFGSPDAPASVEGTAVTWENGTVTAVEIGTALLTQGGKDLIVTVCDRPLTVSLPEEELIVAPGASGSIGGVLSHPVNANLTYTCSDPAIATVDEFGRVTGVAQGTATVTAALPGGQTASRSIRVQSAVESVTLSVNELKVKNNQSQKVLTASVFPEDGTEPLIWSSTDPSIATVDENGVVTGVSNGYALITCTAKYSGASDTCRVKVCDLIQVALTFDDGPSTKYTPKVLDMLDKYHVKATFFMVGNRIGGAKDIVKRMYEAGHELGYHSWSHDYFFNMNKSGIEADYQKYCDALAAACGQKPTVYRAPGGNITDLALRTLPMPHILWSVDTRDWESRNAEKVKQAVLKGLKDGAIILVHDIHGTTYSGVLAALEEVAKKDMDVEFLTVTELLSRDGTPPENGVTYKKG